MRKQKAKIDELARRVAAGEQITLLCSSACVRESRCHRSILKELVERAAGGGAAGGGAGDGGATGGAGE